MFNIIFSEKDVGCCQNIEIFFGQKNISKGGKNVGTTPIFLSVQVV